MTTKKAMLEATKVMGVTLVCVLAIFGWGEFSRSLFPTAGWKFGFLFVTPLLLVMWVFGVLFFKTTSMGTAPGGHSPVGKTKS